MRRLGNPVLSGNEACRQAISCTQTAPARPHTPDRPADSSEEAHQVGISQHFSSLIAHGLDELEEPPGRICSCRQVNAECAIAHFFQGMSHEKLRQMCAPTLARNKLPQSHAMHSHAPTARRRPVRASTDMRCPYGSSRSHSLLTPMI